MTHPNEAPTPEQHFGTMVRQAREARDWTQETLRSHLAERGVQLEKTAMIRLEQGKRPIRLNEVAVLAKLLGLDLQPYTAATPQLTKEEYEQAKKALEEALDQDDRVAAEQRQARSELETRVADLGRKRRYWSEQIWRNRAMISEYEAHSGK